MNILKKLKNLLDNPIIDTIVNIYKKIKSSKSYWSVSYLVLIFTLREAIALQWGDIIQSGIETYAKNSNYPYFWESLKFIFEGGSIEFLFMGIGIFLVLSLIKWNESKKEQIVYHNSVIIEHNRRSYLTFLLIPLILLGIIFTFEKPREYVKSLYQYSKVQPSKKAFSLTDNLSPYHLMPNPTYNEWKIFLKEKKNSQTQNNYKEFIEIKNSIDSFNLLKDFVIYNNDAEKNLQENNDTYYIDARSTLGTPILIDNLIALLKLNKVAPNTIIDYYIDILKLYFRIDDFFDFDAVIYEFKSKGYKIYAEDLNYIASVIQDRNISKINNDNELFSSCYYTYYQDYNKVDISILKEELPYSYCSFDILLRGSTLSTEKKFESIKNFLTKNDKKHNGNVLINAYLNLLTELPSKRKNFYKLLKNYHIDEDSKVSLSLLLAINKEVKENEFRDILTIFYSLKREKLLRDKYLDIKSNKKSIEELFDIFRAEEKFRYLPTQLSAIAKVLESSKVCSNHKNILHTAFGLYMTHIDFLEDETSVFLDKKLIDKFYTMHNINYDNCLKKYATLPREINSEKYKVITDEFLKKSFLKSEKSLVKNRNIDKFINLIFDNNSAIYHLDSDSYMLHFNDSLGEDNQSFSIPKEYIPIIKFIFNNLNEEKELAQMPTILIDSLNEFSIKYQEEIITHKLNNNIALNNLIEILKEKLNNLQNHKCDTCYILFTLQEVVSYTDKFKLLTDFMKNIDLKKCEKYKENFIIDKDSLLYLLFKKINLSKSIIKEHDFNLSISTPTNILEDKILKNSLFKLSNLFSLSFYEKYNSIELKDIINLYQDEYDKDLVNNLLIYSFLIHEKIPVKKMTKLISMIDFKIGKHTYLIPLKNKNKLGKIVKLSYISSFYKGKDNQKIIFGLNYKSSIGLEINSVLGLHEVKVASGFSSPHYTNDTLLLSSYISGDIKELLLKKAIESSDELYNNGSLPNYFINNLSPKYSKVDIAEKLYNLANEHSKEQNTTKKAFHEYRESRRLYIDDNISKNIEKIGHIDFELGLLYFNNKEYSNALIKFQKALNSYEKMDNREMHKKKFMAHTYYFIAKTNFNLLRYKSAKSDYINSLKLYEQAKRTNKYIRKDRLGHVYFELGSLYFNQFKNYRKAIDMYQQSIPLYAKLHTNSNKIKWIANAHKNSAKAYLKLKVNKKAIKEYFKLIKLYKKVKKKNPKYYNEQIAYEAFNLGNIYFDMKQYLNAQKVYYKSLNYMKNKQKKFNFSKASMIANLHRNIAHTYNLLGEFRKAISEYKKALNMYEKLNSTHENRFKKAIINAKNNLELCYKRMHSK